MKIKTLKPFTLRDSSTGALTSPACGSIIEVDTTPANALISAGLAEAYNLIEPTGSQNITANGTYDVTAKASAVVNVSIVTVTYNANGGTGSVDAQTAIAGNSVNLSDGTGLTAPEGKEFAGWATTDSAEEPDVTSPLTVTENITLYAVWVAAAES